MPEYEYEADDKGNMQMVKSLSSTESSHIRFFNCSRCIIQVCWIDYEGVVQMYRRLKPLQFLDLNTFTSHPWIFKDCLTNDRLVVDNKIVFRGPKIKSYYVTEARRHFIRREIVRIVMPMRSLMKLTMVEIVRLLPDQDCLRTLGLPDMLQNELRVLTAIRTQNMET